jgi:ATP-dependent DNA helicase RecQ
MTNVKTLLRQALNNPTAEFREGQKDAIRAVVQPPHRALVVQATGWGKSIVYFIATRMLRDQGKGPTLVVSPLLSLMRDQVRAAQRLGLRAEQYSSHNRDAWPEIDAMLRSSALDVLFVAPERLASDDFRGLVGSSSLSNLGMMVIDEAHCISDWGHDFRPDYQRLVGLIRMLPPQTSVLATTATANERVVEDVTEQIGQGMVVLRGPLARPSLRLQVIDGRDSAERLSWLADHLNDLPGSGIVYTLTKHDAERVAKWLKSRGFSAEAYHSDLPAEAKVELESRLLNNQIKALVATVALGMGFDKPDLGFVVHYQSPGNLVAYYQQIGRAGRAIPEAIAVLFMGHEDTDIHRWFIDNARPPERDITQVLTALADGGLSVPQLQSRLNLTRGQLERVLKTLTVKSPSPIVKSGAAYELTQHRYQHDHAREAALNNRRYQERERFEQFARTRECLMMMVRKELDDPDAAPCGWCATCLGSDVISPDISDTTLLAAMEFLQRSEFPLEPRKMWIKDALPAHGFSGKISEKLLCETGICLSQWGDPGLGSWVKEDKRAGQFRRELATAAANALTRTAGLPRIDWVCAVPSLRSPQLVPAFARLVADSIGVPYVDAVTKLKEVTPQREQKNSFHQAHNLDGAFAVQNVRPGVALLVDDTVDSKWTLTVIGALLRASGASAVVPLALASTSKRRESD